MIKLRDMKKNVVLGISSGIAAYKCIDLVRLLREDGVSVNVIMTEHASKMLPSSEFEKVSGNKVYIELFEKDFNYRNILKSRKVDHIELAANSELMLIAPATANIIGKLAHGIADDFLTTTALAVTAPIVICPSMNVNMWNNPVVQSNISKLINLGFHIIEPCEGRLACGYEGKGRLAEIADIRDYVISRLKNTGSLKGKKVIVTAGGTSERIDDVRYITNRSSGKMGKAIAEECFLRGADVLLLRSKNTAVSRYPVKQEIFSTADDLFNLIKKYVTSCDYIFHAAAVSDFKVKNDLRGKISSEKSITLVLEPQLKILDQIKKLNPEVLLIGFKAESGEKTLITKAISRMKTAKADFMVANDIGQTDIGFESDKNEVYIISTDGTVQHLPKDSKKIIAKKIVDFVFCHS